MVPTYSPSHQPIMPPTFTPMKMQSFIGLQQSTAHAARLYSKRIAALQAALSGTARNPNLGTLSLALDDPPTRPQVQQILDAYNALLNQLTRV